MKKHTKPVICMETCHYQADAMCDMVSDPLCVPAADILKRNAYL